MKEIVLKRKYTIMTNNDTLSIIFLSDLPKWILMCVKIGIYFKLTENFHKIHSPKEEKLDLGNYHEY